MSQYLAQIALIVDDYDKAIEFFIRKLNFQLLEDTILSESKRWVRVAPHGSQGCCLLLAKATNTEQRSRIGNQSGGRVFLFLHTADFKNDYIKMLANGIQFVRKPVIETWGTVAVFEDLYGNLWDLIEPIAPTNKN